MTKQEATADGVIVVYDGACPFCRNYTKLVTLRAATGAVQLVDARDGGPAVAACRARDLDLDEGMVVILDGRFYHGADAVNRLALLSTASGAFNRFNRLLFRSPAVSRTLYPVLRAARNATLRLLGVPKLEGQ